MKNLWLGGIVLMASSSPFAQGTEELSRRLAETEAENRQLRERIDTLERELTPRRIRRSSPSPQAAPAAPATSVTPDGTGDDLVDSNRALERALVREGGLLLSPGALEVEPDFVYSHSNANGLRRDSYGPGLTLRAGLPLRSQIDLSLPYVFERRRIGATSTRSHGRGDFSLGLSHQFLADRAGMPSVFGSLLYQAATGRNTVFESATPVARGSGFDALQLSLNAVKRVDPLVFFGGYSYTHSFSETRGAFRVRPGRAHGLRIGTALATGPDTSLRAAFNVDYFGKTRVDGVALAGSDDPSAMLELGGSVVLSESMALDVLIGAGLTSNAPDYRIGIALPIRF